METMEIYRSRRNFNVTDMRNFIEGEDAAILKEKVLIFTCVITKLSLN